jgi:alkylated DNA nucleotide flippase Atl1
MTRIERALQVWQVLTCAAHNRQVLTYELVAERIGLGGGARALAQILGIVMRYCEENKLPPLTVLVVKKGTGKPGTGLTTIEEVNRDRESVFGFGWHRLTPPSKPDFEGVAGAE